MTRTIVAIALAGLVVLPGCQSAYYSAMEKVGYAKRDILTSRVKSARDSQEDAKEEITDALTAFGKVVSYQGGNLETQYNSLSDQLDDSEDAAAAVKKRVADVESVGTALFKEWKAELAKYSSAELRSKSEQQLRQTRSRYDAMLGAMKRAEARLDPALQPMRDQVLYLKHNLNARAISSLGATHRELEADISRLIGDMEASIREAQNFIRDMKSS